MKSQRFLNQDPQTQSQQLQQKPAAAVNQSRASQLPVSTIKGAKTSRETADVQINLLKGVIQRQNRLQHEQNAQKMLEMEKPLFNPMEPEVDNAERQRREKIAVSELIQKQRDLIRSRSPHTPQREREARDENPARARDANRPHQEKPAPLIEKAEQSKQGKTASSK